MLLCTVQALGEMAVLYPVNGAFFSYGVRFIDPAWVSSTILSGDVGGGVPSKKKKKKKKGGGIRNWLNLNSS